MRISHRYKFIFISKPRCASTTLRTLLDPYSDIFSDSKPPYHHHATALELKLHFDEMKWNWSDYFIFTTVRNPWEMMGSYYKFFRPDIHGIYNFEKERNGINYQPDCSIPFSEWIRTGMTYHRIRFIDGRFERNIWVNGFSKLTLANTINDTNGNPLVTRVFKTEELAESVIEIFRIIGITDVPEILKINTSEPFNYRDYYSPETRKIVEEEFESDISFGHYKF